MNITPTLHKQCKPKQGQPVYAVSKNTCSRAMASREKTYSYKGVEYTFAETVPEDLVCPICQDLLDDTQQTPDSMWASLLQGMPEEDNNQPGVSTSLSTKLT